jgi:hypothetical protein
MLVSKIDAGKFNHRCCATDKRGDSPEATIRARLTNTESVSRIESFIGTRWRSLDKPYGLTHVCCQRQVRCIFRPYEDWFERTTREYRLPVNDYTRLPDYVLLGGGGPPGMSLDYEEQL